MRFLFVFLLSWVTLTCFSCETDVEVHLKEDFLIEFQIDDVLTKRIKDILPDGTDQLPEGFKLTVPFQYSKQFDVRNHKKLKAHKDSITGMKFKRMYYRIEENTLNFSIPNDNDNLRISIAKPDENEEFTSHEPVGFFFPIPKHKQGIFDLLQIEEDSVNTVQEAMNHYYFSMKMEGNLELDATRSREIPSGNIKIILSVELALKMNVF